MEIGENRGFRIVFEVLQANDATDLLLHRKLWSRDVVEYSCQPAGKPMDLLHNFPVLPCGGAGNGKGIAQQWHNFLGVDFLEVALRCPSPKYSPESTDSRDSYLL